MSQLSKDARVAALGAAAGLFSISVFLLVERIDSYYTYLETINYDAYERRFENLSWLPFAFWHVLLTFVGSFISHRYVATPRTSPFFIWQLIGVVTLLSWVVTICVVVVLEALTLGNTDSVWYMLSSIKPSSVAKYASVVIACHVMYGSALQAASREYIAQPRHNPDENSIATMPRRSFYRSSTRPCSEVSRKQTENCKGRDITKPLGLS